MRDQELKDRLAEAVTRAAPDDLAGVLSRCQQQTQKGEVVPMTKTKAAHPVRRWALIAACLALVLVGGGAGMLYHSANAVTSVVSIDVNPSIELRVNRNEKVLSCIPLNEEAHIALRDMNDGKDLEGSKLTVAANAIVGALVRSGYLDGLSNAILVSVEDKDQARAARMEEELRTAIGGLLEVQAPNATVLSQVLDAEAPTTENMPFDSGLSTGKAALVKKVMEMNGTLALNSATAFEQLSALTVEELSDLLETGETRIPIGRTAAAVAAETYAGTAGAANVTTDVDPELEKRPAHYEVELKVNGAEFEYIVDAFTGEILYAAGVPVFADAQTPAPVVTPAPTIPPTAGTSPAPVTTPTATPTPATTLPPATVPPMAGGLIGEDAAWAAACAHAGCDVGDVNYAHCELEEDDGVYECYELEFCWNGDQYEYEIDCRSGEVMKYDREVCDERLHSCAGGHHGYHGHH